MSVCLTHENQNIQHHIFLPPLQYVYQFLQLGTKYSKLILVIYKAQ